MPDREDFRAILAERMAEAIGDWKPHLQVTAGAIHRTVGDYPGNNHRMPVCCSVMREEMGEGDVIVTEPPSGQGASLTIRYWVRETRGSAIWVRVPPNMGLSFDSQLVPRAPSHRRK